MIVFRLKEIMEEKNLKISDLNEQTGISRNSISSLLNGKTRGIQFDTLEKIAVDAFKAGYEVSEAEEFEDESGKVIFCFDIISEVELKPEIIDAQQKEILPLVEKYKGIYDGWGTYFEDPNAEDDEYGDDGEFFDDEDVEDDNERLH